MSENPVVMSNLFCSGHVTEYDRHLKKLQCPS